MVKNDTSSLYRNKKGRNDLDEFWSGIQRGNAESLSQLYCVSYSWLSSYGYRIIPRSGLVEDAIQELFLFLWNYYIVGKNYMLTLY
jgi:hypothetical protein